MDINQDQKEIICDSNFHQLREHLKENEVILDKKDFKGILSAMNTMTLTYITKYKAIRNASKKTGATQTLIKSYIDEMGIESETSYYNRKVFKNTHARSDAIASKLIDQK